MPRRYYMLAILLGTALAASWAIPRFLARGGALRPAGERREMPQIQLPDLDGATWRLSDQRGKVVLVNFWATWCAPCRSETPALVRLAARLRGADFEMAGVTLDERPERKVRDFAARFQMNYPVLLPSESERLEAGIRSLPTTFLIDRQGRVAKTYVGEIDRGIETDIEKLLAEPR